MVTEKQLANLRPFSATHKPPIVRRGPSVLTHLKKLLEKKIAYEDPTTHLHVKGKICQAIALRAIYNALEGDQNAIEDILDRIDGKTAQKLIGEGFENRQYIIIRADNSKAQSEAGSVRI
jgi:hypothetical protein